MNVSISANDAADAGSENQSRPHQKYKQFKMMKMTLYITCETDQIHWNAYLLE